MSAEASSISSKDRLTFTKPLPSNDKRIHRDRLMGRIYEVCSREEFRCHHDTCHVS
jgi:hypothetical protein